MEDQRFYLRLVQGKEVIYESPQEGDKVEIIQPKDCSTVAEDFVNAINNLNLTVKAILIK